VLTLFAHRCQPGVAQHLEVLGDGRLADTQLRDDLRHARATLSRTGVVEQKLQYVATRSVRDHIEDVCHVLRLARAVRGVP
jgi:hypothetical protein